MSDDGITKIADDIIQVQIPLPYVLNIVNCYLLRGAEGWTLVDTGLNTSAARSQWKSALASLGIEPADIEKIVLTHMHPDHFGMAGWWQRQTETPSRFICRSASSARCGYSTSPAIRPCIISGCWIAAWTKHRPTTWKARSIARGT